METFLSGYLLNIEESKGELCAVFTKRADPSIGATFTEARLSEAVDNSKAHGYETSILDPALAILHAVKAETGAFLGGCLLSIEDKKGELCAVFTNRANLSIGMTFTESHLSETVNTSKARGLETLILEPALAILRAVKAGM